jgi:hypothetical protein
MLMVSDCHKNIHDHEGLSWAGSSGAIEAPDLRFPA